MDISNISILCPSNTFFSNYKYFTWEKKKLLFENLFSFISMILWYHFMKKIRPVQYFRALWKNKFWPHLTQKRSKVVKITSTWEKRNKTLKTCSCHFHDPSIQKISPVQYFRTLHDKQILTTFDSKAVDTHPVGRSSK